MKITAVKLYTQALEELAEHLEEAKQTPALLVATLCLMAYFEVSSLVVTTNPPESRANVETSPSVVIFPRSLAVSKPRTIIL